MYTHIYIYRHKYRYVYIYTHINKYIHTYCPHLGDAEPVECAWCRLCRLNWLDSSKRRCSHRGARPSRYRIGERRHLGHSGHPIYFRLAARGSVSVSRPDEIRLGGRRVAAGHNDVVPRPTDRQLWLGRGRRPFPVRREAGHTQTHNENNTPMPAFPCARYEGQVTTQDLVHLGKWVG